MLVAQLRLDVRDSDWAAKKSGRGVGKPGLDACAKGLITLRRLCLAPNYSGKIDTMIMSKRDTVLHIFLLSFPPRNFSGFGSFYVTKRTISAEFFCSECLFRRRSAADIGVSDAEYQNN